MSKPTLRFNDFELDLTAHQLRRQGEPIRLEKRPFELLVLLASRGNALVTREEIVSELWPNGVVIDFEVGVNTLARKVRRALGDSPASPRFIETVPGAGYRFIATVSVQAAERRPEPLRIAVLPFENLADGELSYLATGLAEESSTSLAQVGLENVNVISHISLQAYVRGGKSFREIADELGAHYIVASSLRSERRTIRVTARLLRTRDHVQVWSASFDRELTSVLGLQRELATAIAEQIRLRLEPGVAAALVARQTANPAAYDRYLRGRYQWGLLTPAGSKQALDEFDRAIAEDGSYALAWAGIAQALSTAPIVGDAAPSPIAARAREAADNAVRFGPQLSEAQYALGYFHFWLGWDWPSAERALREAVRLDANSGIGWMMLGHVLSQTGQQLEASAALRRARELEPLFSQTFALSAQIAFQGREFATAAEHARQATAIAPEAWIGHLQLAQALTELGDHDQALQSFARAQQYSGGNSKSIAFRGVLHARMGNRREAHAALAALRARENQHYVPPYAIAIVHAALGEPEAAFDALDRACAVRDVHLAFLPVDCRWDDLRSEARLAAVLERCRHFGTRERR